MLAAGRLKSQGAGSVRRCHETTSRPGAATCVHASYADDAALLTTTRWNCGDNATDTTPWGNYSRWNTNEPGTDPVETISAATSAGGWIDWGPTNNADGMAELEYSRVLNLAKTSNHGSIDVASSTAGTAYLVKSTATVTNEASITSLADSQWNSASVTGSILGYEDFSRAPKGWTQSNTDLSGTLGRYGNNGHKKQRLAGRCEVAGFYWLTCN